MRICDPLITTFDTFPLDGKVPVSSPTQGDGNVALSSLLERSITFITVSDKLPQDIVSNAEHYAIRYTTISSGIPKSYVLYYTRRIVTENKLVYSCMTNGVVAYVLGDLQSNTWSSLVEKDVFSSGTDQIHELSETATESDLTSETYFVIDTATGPKKLPCDELLNIIQSRIASST